MRLSSLFTLLFTLVGACATDPPPEAQTIPVQPAPQPPVPSPSFSCGPPPAPPNASMPSTCTNPVLKSGQSWHDQLTLQLSNGATTRIDCPRMRYRGQDTPICVVTEVAGRARGACCPAGHSDPNDPACVDEGTVDEMYRRNQVWEWCDKNKPQSRPCEPCVWVTGAER
jgi:hypothetical protein